METFPQDPFEMVMARKVSGVERQVMGLLGFLSSNLVAGGTVVEASVGIFGVLLRFLLFPQFHPTNMFHFLIPSLAWAARQVN